MAQVPAKIGIYRLDACDCPADALGHSGTSTLGGVAALASAPAETVCGGELRDQRLALDVQPFGAGDVGGVVGIRQVSFNLEETGSVLAPSLGVDRVSGGGGVHGRTVGDEVESVHLGAGQGKELREVLHALRVAHPR